MAPSKSRLLVCNCESSMPLDGPALAKMLDLRTPLAINSQLCRAQLDNFRRAIELEEPLVVACTQEMPLFEETRTEAGIDLDVTYTNIRERAGWSAEGGDAAPKVAALLAEACAAATPARTIGLSSDGVCLVYGKDQAAVEAARQLAGKMDVTLLLTEPEEIVPPIIMTVPIFKGTIVAAEGHLGRFDIVVNDYAPAIVSSRKALAFAAPRNGAASRCDVILDLTGKAPLFPSADKRDGYFNPDPGNPAAVQRALFDAVDLVGEFEKPLYVKFDADLCAHSRSRQTGCRRCLDVCPASAIRPNGDVVEIDAFLCGGCGGCNSVCPTGAASYALPPTEELIERLRTLTAAYFRAGGNAPRLLVHDDAYGMEMIAAIARFRDGLPADMLPFSVNEVTQLSIDFLLSAFAYGVRQISIIVPPKRRDELTGLAAQIGLCEAILDGLGHGGGRFDTLMEEDPDRIAARLWQKSELKSGEPGAFLPLGGKRSRARLALQHLHQTAPAPVDIVPLPPEAPFGAVEVDVENCTLCLACVGACPTGALIDNPDKPQLRFQEDACIQCGLCKNTCPEKVISLVPRVNFAETAKQAAIVKEEAPFECVRCGKPFGIKSSIERIVEKLGDKHWMFQDSGRIDLIRMCEDCRVVVQFDSTDNPLAGGDRPMPRTTDDYLREREEIEAARAKFRQNGGEGDGTG